MLKKILHIIASADPAAGGPIEGAVRTGEIWAAQGNRQDLLTFDPPGAGFLPDYPGQIFELGGKPSRAPWSRYSYSPHAFRWLRENVSNYDAVLVAGLWNFSAMAARFGVVGRGTPCYVYTHGMLDPWFRRTYPLKHLAKQMFWLFNEGPLLAHADGVLFTTEEEKRLADRAFWPYRVKDIVVGYGTADAPAASPDQDAAFAALLPQLVGRPYLLFLSRIHRKKGCDLLVEAFARVAARFPDVQLVIAGPDQEGLRPHLEAIARAGGVAERLHFPGMVSGAAKWGAFRNAEAFILPSHQENFGVAVAEAMACAKPVLISDKVNIWHEILADGAGLVETDSVDGTVALIDRFFALSAAEREAMGAAARRGFQKRFLIEAVATRLIDTIAA